MIQKKGKIVCSLLVIVLALWGAFKFATHICNVIGEYAYAGELAIATAENEYGGNYTVVKRVGSSDKSGVYYTVKLINDKRNHVIAYRVRPSQRKEQYTIQFVYAEEGFVIPWKKW